MAKKNKVPDNVIAQNKKARFDFFIEEDFEAGLVLQGWEVKSLRLGKVQLIDSHIIIKHNEAWLLGAQIQPLTTSASHIETDPIRTRKLMLHRREINKLMAYRDQKGYTIVALSLYWKQNHIKIKIALAKGKKQHDKRETSKNRDWQRDKARIMKTQ
tara:strand:- start:97 stop:567 length:471 start_codon:yes stop_codon:yes gene_type:complete